MFLHRLPKVVVSAVEIRIPFYTLESCHINKKKVLSVVPPRPHNNVFTASAGFSAQGSVGGTGLYDLPGPREIQR